MALIKSLTVEKFRGILDSTLPLDGKSLILHGENGCGKSSFVDAIEFFYKGEVSHLQGAEGISLDRHGPHALHDKDSSRVIVEFIKPDETLSRTFNGLNRTSAPLASHLALGADASFVLRRRNLLGFIAAQAATRYDQLAELIGITDLDAVELNLKHQTDEAANAVQAARQRSRTASTNLSNALGQRVGTDEAILTALNAKLATLGQKPLESLSEVKTRKAVIVAEAKSPADVARAVALNTAKTTAENLRDALTLLDKHTSFWKKIEAFQRDTAAIREQAYHSVLERAAELLESQQPANCPVCERPFDEHLALGVVIARVQSRLSALQAASQKGAELQKAKASLRADVDAFLKSLKSGRDQIRTQLPQANLDALNTIGNSLSQLSRELEAEVTQLRLKPASGYLSIQQRTACAELLSNVAQQLQRLSQQTAPTEKDKSVATAVELLAQVGNERTALNGARLDIGAKSAVQKVISAIYERFLETKKTEVQRIFDELQDEMRKFYDVIHPGEGHRAVSLILSPGRRASAHIKMGFYNRNDEDPRGYNSEAHLDSLGVCIFLAFTKRFNGGFPLIVLDDVVSSVDAAHRSRVCRLLCEEFADSQLIVTTHDYIWMEEWEAHQRALNASHRFTHLRILNWSLDHGPTLDKYKPRWESLSEKLAAGDREGAASETRRILEWFLLEMCFNSEAPVPLTRNSRYTAGQLYDPLLSRLKKLNKDIQANNAAVFQTLQVNGIFGNLLTHNNLQAGNVSMAEVEAFAVAVTSLHNLFYCQACGQMVKYDRNDREMKCKCRAKLWPTS